MLKNNFKKLIISLIVVLLVGSVGHIVFAAEDNDINMYFSGDMYQGDSDDYIDEGEEPEQIPDGGEKSTDDSGEKLTEEEEELPGEFDDAGLEDYPVAIFMGVLAVVAIYSYKKVCKFILPH